MAAIIGENKYPAINYLSTSVSLFSMNIGHCVGGFIAATVVIYLLQTDPAISVVVAAAVSSRDDVQKNNQ